MTPQWRTSRTRLGLACAVLEIDARTSRMLCYSDEVIDVAIIKPAKP